MQRLMYYDYAFAMGFGRFRNKYILILEKYFIFFFIVEAKELYSILFN